MFRALAVTIRMEVGEHRMCRWPNDIKYTLNHHGDSDWDTPVSLNNIFHIPSPERELLNPIDWEEYLQGWNNVRQDYLDHQENGLYKYDELNPTYGSHPFLAPKDVGLVVIDCVSKTFLYVIDPLVSWIGGGYRYGGEGSDHFVNFDFYAETDVSFRRPRPDGESPNHGAICSKYDFSVSGINKMMNDLTESLDFELSEDERFLWERFACMAYRRKEYKLRRFPDLRYRPGWARSISNGVASCSPSLYKDEPATSSVNLAAEELQRAIETETALERQARLYSDESYIKFLKETVPSDLPPT